MPAARATTRAPVKLSLADPRFAALVPAPARDAVIALWAFDRACASALQLSRDPHLQLIRLTWWRDAVDGFERDAPVDPVLRDLRRVIDAGVARDMLMALPDAWADFAEAPLTATALHTFADRRGAILYEATAHLAGTMSASGKSWALTDVAMHLSDTSLAAQLYGDAAAIGAEQQSNPVGALAALDRLSLQIAQASGHRSPLAERFLFLRAQLAKR